MQQAIVFWYAISTTNSLGLTATTTDPRQVEICRVLGVELVDTGEQEWTYPIAYQPYSPRLCYEAYNHCFEILGAGNEKKYWIGCPMEPGTLPGVVHKSRTSCDGGPPARAACSRN